MLADALSPHGSNATLASVGTLSEGFERFVTSPLYLVGYVRWDASVTLPRTGLLGNFAALRPRSIQLSHNFRLPVIWD